MIKTDSSMLFVSCLVLFHRQLVGLKRARTVNKHDTSITRDSGIKVNLGITGIVSPMITVYDCMCL